MTVGNFTPFLGTLGNDPLIDSFFAEDNNNNLQANSLEIVYGLGGSDNLTTSDLNFTPDDVAILVGGEGSDQYLVRDNSTVVILDNGLFISDTLVASGITSDNNQGLTIDNGRHLYLFDTTTDTYILLPDYRNPENQLEFFDLAGESLTFEELTERIDMVSVADPADVAPNFLGDFTFEQLANDPSIPEAARLDLASVGLSPETIDSDLQTIVDTANNFEDTILLAENGQFEGSLSDNDNSYVFNDEQVFYDFYSISTDFFDVGALVTVDVTSSDFDPLLFVLDSRGNVVEFDNNPANDNSGELSFIVGSGEPLLIAVESLNSDELGDYTIAFDTQVDLLDVDDIERDDSNFDDIALANIETIQTIDSLTGSLIEGDLLTVDDSNPIFLDIILLDGSNVGEEIQVTLDSDFDATLGISGFDSDGNEIIVLDDIDDLIGAGIEQGSFTVEADLTYLIGVSSVDPNITGEYTLTTELI